jgi:hypothetical protein
MQRAVPPPCSLAQWVVPTPLPDGMGSGPTISTGVMTFGTVGTTPTGTQRKGIGGPPCVGPLGLQTWTRRPIIEMI